jgi:hypothetical protein
MPNAATALAKMKSPEGAAVRSAIGYWSSRLLSPSGAL